MTLGERILYFRADRGLSQTQMAELLNTTALTIHNIETGKSIARKTTVIRFLKKMNELEEKEND